MPKAIFLVFIFGLLQIASASSILEGEWHPLDSQDSVRLVEFNHLLTFSGQSYYSNGAEVKWFFKYSLPKDRQVNPGELLNGRVRSVDSYYNCVFDEKAQAQLQADGTLKIHFPTLTYHRETRSVRDGRSGHYYERQVDWTDWGWVERIYHFPIERYRVISSECVVDQRNWITQVLIRK